MSKLDKLSQEAIAEQVKAAILAIIAEKEYDRYTLITSFSDLDFGPIEYKKLRENLSITFGEALHDTFLTRYQTPQAIINYFIERKNFQFRDWLYAIQFVELPIPATPVSETTYHGTWIVFSDKRGFSD